MEGLIFFIAMTVFVIRTVNKLKKAAAGNKKTAAGKTSVVKEHPFKGKLDELVRSLEEAEKQKKAGQNSNGFENPDILNKDEKLENEYLSSADEGHQEVSSTRASSVEYDFKGDERGKDSLPDNKSTSADEHIKKKKLNRVFNEQGKKNRVSLYSASVKKKKSSNILASLSRYPELQRAVVLKEIFDSPVSEKF